MRLNNLSSGQQKIRMGSLLFGAPEIPFFQVINLEFLTYIKMIQLKEFGSFGTPRQFILRNDHETE